MANKTCPICGRTFTPQINIQKYCGKECARQVHTAQKRIWELNHAKSKPRRKRPLVVKNCANCNKEFTPTKRKQLCCCEVCRVERLKNINAANKLSKSAPAKQLKTFKLTKAQIEQRDRLKNLLLQRRAQREYSFITDHKGGG